MSKLIGSELRRILNDLPVIGKQLLTAWDHTRSSCFVLNSIYNSIRGQGNAKINPFDIIWIKTRDIKYRTTEISGDDFTKFSMWKDAGKVVGGNWDKKTIRFEDCSLHQDLKSHFEDGVDWEETEFYNRLKNRIINGRVVHGATSVEELKYRCEQLDSLHYNIKEHGYLSQKQILKRGYEDIDSVNKNLTMIEDIFDEITVNIGRDGSFLFNDSRHRLSIAKILDIQQVPVRIVARHQEWQKKRNTACEIENLVGYNHIDFSNLQTGPITGLYKAVYY